MKKVAGLATLAILAAAAFFVFQPGSDPVTSDRPDAPAVQSPLVETADSYVEPPWEPAQTDYVGIESCRQCHADRVQEFVSTDHFRTSRLPAADELGPHFAAGNNVYQTRNPDLRFEMSIEDGQPTITATRSQETLSREIGIVYGAGAADEVYLGWVDDGLFELPVAYLHPLNQWANAPGYLDGTLDFNRPIVPRCLECHTTYVAHRPGSENEYHRPSALLGVSCERCHGPGRQHVEFHLQHPDESTARHIVQPADLPRDRQIENCGQCHSNTTKRRTPPFEFRPGDSLAQHFRTDLNRHPEFDHTANHIRYLRESKCFQQSDSMTCTTCHDPHTAAGPHNAAAVEVSCLSCHQREDCGERVQLPEALRDRCLDCHMPEKKVMSVTFDTADDDLLPLIDRRSHRIGTDRAAIREVRLLWLIEQNDAQLADQIAELKREVVEHHLQSAQSLLAEHRLIAASGALRSAGNWQPDDQIEQRLRSVLADHRRLRTLLREAMGQIELQRMDAARETLRQVLEINPRQAVARGKLGTLLAVNQQKSEALTALQQAADDDPDDPYSVAMLGWLAYLDGNHAQAVQWYQRALSIAPFNAKLHYQTGMALFALQRHPEAIEHLQRSVEIQPRQPDCHHLLSQAHQANGSLNLAIEASERAVFLTRGQDPAVLQTLASQLQAAGKDQAALQRMQQAVQAAGGDSSRIRSLQKQIREIRNRIETH